MNHRLKSHMKALNNQLHDERNQMEILNNRSENEIVHQTQMVVDSIVKQIEQNDTFAKETLKKSWAVVRGRKIRSTHLSAFFH